jgi:peptidoglycan/xylan/chitin deacetylase (PgdA/CDA1 family)
MVKYKPTLKHVAIFVTAVVIVAGFAMISPLFLRAREPQPPRQKVMLGVSISSTDNVMEWSQNMAQLLFDYNAGASLFMVGKVAQEYPDAVWCFNNAVDVGSRTYSNVDLTGISDYSVKLEEVKEGKSIVDDVGNLYSRIFRAPFGAVDQDIYSLLSRSGILVDFSYKDYYNVYRDGRFVKHDAKTYLAADISPDTFSTLAYSNIPIIIFFENTQAVSDIARLLSVLQQVNVEFVNASELTGLELTTRGS